MVDDEQSIKCGFSWNPISDLQWKIISIIVQTKLLGLGFLN